MAKRLDAAPWRPIHRRIAAALGVGWALDAFEVQIIGSVIPAISPLRSGASVIIDSPMPLRCHHDSVACRSMCEDKPSVPTGARPPIRRVAAIDTLASP